MKNLMVLERKDLDVLKAGGTLTLSLPGGTQVLVGYDGAVHGTHVGPNPKSKESAPKAKTTYSAKPGKHKCTRCSASFKRPAGLGLHKWKMHKIKGLRQKGGK